MKKIHYITCSRCKDRWPGLISFDGYETLCTKCMWETGGYENKGRKCAIPSNSSIQFDCPIDSSFVHNMCMMSSMFPES